MKTLLFSLAIVMVMPSAVLSGPLEAQKMRQAQLEPQKEKVRVQYRQEKEEQRRLWRQKYEQDVKRLVGRLQRDGVARRASGDLRMGHAPQDRDACALGKGRRHPSVL